MSGETAENHVLGFDEFVSATMNSLTDDEGGHLLGEKEFHLGAFPPSEKRTLKDPLRGEALCLLEESLHLEGHMRG
jgi:hypothetical protein